MSSSTTSTYFAQKKKKNQNAQRYCCNCIDHANLTKHVFKQQSVCAVRIHSNHGPITLTAAAATRVSRACTEGTGAAAPLAERSVQGWIHRPDDPPSEPQQPTCSCEMPRYNLPLMHPRCFDASAQVLWDRGGYLLWRAVMLYYPSILHPWIGLFILSCRGIDMHPDQTCLMLTAKPCTR